jgi:hypothetical protein
MRLLRPHFKHYFHKNLRPLLLTVMDEKNGMTPTVAMGLEIG